MLNGGEIGRSGNRQSSLVVLENWPVLRAWMGRDAWAHWNWDDEVGDPPLRMESRGGACDLGWA